MGVFKVTERKKHNPLRVIPILLLVLTLLLSACGGKTPAPSESPGAASPSATAESAAPTEASPAETSSGPSHNDTLRLPILTTLIATDPHYTAQNSDYTLYTVLYESLYTIDSENNATPCLATDYEVSEDSLTYTYHLKAGVKWQTGEDFKASDVVYSIRRAQESPYTAGYISTVTDVKTTDDLTVVFTLAALSPTFNIDVNRVMILSENATKDLAPGFTDEIPGGTGPYTLATWAPDLKTVITRNESYHGDPAPIGTIEFNVFGDSTAALRAFEAGELDWIQVPAADWARIQSAGKYKTFLQDTITTVFFTMNNQKAPFDNALVRQAFNYAVNRDDMLFAALEDTGRVVHSLGNPALVFGIPEAGEIFEYTYDPQKAKDLLAEAGYPDGLTLNDPILAIGTDEFTVPAQVLQQQLLEIGVKAEVQTMEQSAYIGDVIGGNYTIGAMALGLDIDAGVFAMAYTTTGIDALNLARYSNPRVDELFDLASKTLDQDARKAYFQEAFDIASREAAYIPLYSMQAAIATDNDLNSSIYKTYYSWSWN
jgi:peptide/nickel transport system substrate-binding protein